MSIARSERGRSQIATFIYKSFIDIVTIVNDGPRNVSPIQVRYFPDKEDGPYLFFIRFAAISLPVPTVAHNLRLAELLAPLSEKSTGTSEIFFLVVRTRYPFHGFIESVLHWMLRVEYFSCFNFLSATDGSFHSLTRLSRDDAKWLDGDRQQFETFVRLAFQSNPPGPGQTFTIDKTPFPIFTWAQPSATNAQDSFMIHVVRDLVHFVDWNLFPKLFTALLLEKTVIIYHCDDRVVSNIIMALHFLLAPLRWAVGSISLLPGSFDHLLNTPTRLLVGTTRPVQTVQRDSVLVDLVQGNLQIWGESLPVYAPAAGLSQLVLRWWHEDTDLMAIVTKFRHLIKGLTGPIIPCIIPDSTDQFLVQSQFKKDWYLSAFGMHSKGFLEALCATQMFQMYVEQMCRSNPSDTNGDDSDHLRAGRSEVTTVTRSNCTYYLQSNQRDFPMSLTCIDGCAVRLFALSPSVCFTSTASSLLLLCIPSSIESICDSYFAGCRRLLALVFETGCSVSVLGESALAECSSLQYICIPSSIKTIPKECLDRCRSLSTFPFAGGCQVLTLGESAFQFCSSLQSICIPSSIEIICTSCFCHCTSLSDVTFERGSRLSILGEFAFHRCSSLQSICIPSSVTRVSRSCFADCINLSKLMFDSGSELSTIEDFAFQSC
jgi:hypothetical protein